ncbi:MAG: indolepyruvate ferredoxin oxidoreductase subunit beta [Candidatus Methanomethylicia archaeon]|jgi:indolepyruvate ferredoxin oxidoreductase beta subunit|nr:indolepyruvate ferredoxin oxidoreductase subunit beta [Candidatus Methanomethylicia archaeon]
MGKSEINIVISGVGGQGNVKAAQILGAAAIKAGYRVRISDVYGIAQRGGPVVSHIRIGEEIYGFLVEENKADIVLGFEPMEALRAVAKFLRVGGLVIVNTRPIYPVEVNIGKAAYPNIGEILSTISKVAGSVITLDAAEVAKDSGIPIASNIVMLGVLAGSGALPFEAELLRDAIKENIPRFLEENLRAFEAGFSIGKTRVGYKEWTMAQ